MNMENKEFEFKGMTINGIMMMIIVILACLLSAYLAVMALVNYNFWLMAIAVPLFILAIICACGFIQLEPGEARVIMFFGKYRGTFSKAGFYWINPFYSTKKLSLRARNLDADPIKVNDKSGNPVMIGLVLVWKLKDTYKAMFEVDTQTMAAARAGSAEFRPMLHFARWQDNTPTTTRRMRAVSPCAMVPTR